jgi:hypothetical protein
MKYADIPDRTRPSSEAMTNVWLPEWLILESGGALLWSVNRTNSRRRLICVTKYHNMRTKESDYGQYIPSIECCKARRQPHPAGTSPKAVALVNNASVVLDEARRAGLLDGEKTEHVSFRAPKALIEAARRESGATKLTELGILALAMLAQPDPAANFLKKTSGTLGADHKLDY